MLFCLFFTKTNIVISLGMSAKDKSLLKYQSCFIFLYFVVVVVVFCFVLFFFVVVVFFSNKLWLSIAFELSSVGMF